MSLETAQKLLSRKKKIMSRSFLNSGTLIVIFRLGCSSRPSTKYFFSSAYSISILLSPSPSKLGRQPCGVACLLVFVSGYDSQGKLYKEVSLEAKQVPVKQGDGSKIRGQHSMVTVFHAFGVLG